MYTVTFLYNLHIYIKMAPQGVQQSNNMYQNSDPVKDYLTAPLKDWTLYKISGTYIIKLLHFYYIKFMFKTQYLIFCRKMI